MDLLDLLFANVTDRFYLIPSQSGHHTMTIRLADKLVSIVSFNKTVANTYLRAVRHLEVSGLDTTKKPKIEKAQHEIDGEFQYKDDDELIDDGLVNESDVYKDLVDMSDFTILLLDSETTEISMPEMDFLSTPRDEPRKAFENEEGTIIATIEGEDPALSIINFRKRLALLWLPSVSRIPGYQLATPLRTIFHWILGENGIQLVHGAAVGYKGDGLLLSGLSGSGKTVASLSCLKAGWSFLGDDFVAIGPGVDSGSVIIYSLYSSARLHPEIADQFDFLEAAITDDKSLYFLHPRFAEQFKLEIPLHRLFMPNISEESSPSSRLSTSDVVKEIMVPTLAYLPGRERTTLRNLSYLISNFPCHSACINGPISGIPEKLRRLTLLSLV